MKNKFLNLLISFLTMTAFFIDVNSIYMNKLKQIYKVDLLIVNILIFLFYIFYSNIKDKKLDIYRNILALVLSIFMIFGNSYILLNSWDLVFGSLLLFFISIISLIGYYFFFKRIFILLDRVELKEFKISKTNKIMKMINEKPFITSLVIILIFWIIYIIAFYPIILSPDPSNQIKQYFNLDTKYSENVNLINPNVKITNHHPVLHTFLLGTCLSIGRFLGNDNFGLFIYSFVQILLLSGTLAYTIKYLKKLNASDIFIYILLGIYSLVPMFPFYAMSAVKDVIFSCLIIWYTILLFDFIHFYCDRKIDLKKLILLFFIILFISLFRNNGMYVIILSLPFLVIINKHNRFGILTVLIIYLITFKSYTSILLPKLGITDGSIREALSIPFQQTARYVKSYPSDIEPEDIDIIDKVLGYDDLASRYKPNISDPVKNKFNKDATSKELKDYFKVWVKYLFRHPDAYIQATINNVYGYFYPNKLKWYIYYKFDSRITSDNLTSYHYNSLSGVRNVLINYGTKFPYLPIIGFISNIGFNTWVLIYITIRTIKLNKKYLVALSPLLITLLVCIASPVNTYFRYAMPYIFMIPMVISVYIILRKKVKNER